MTPAEVPAELVEAAARAAYYADPFYRSVFGKMLEPREVLPWDELDLADIQEMRTNARHALAAVLPEIQAQALRNEADRTHTYHFSTGDRVEQVHGERSRSLMHHEAARLTTTTVEARDAQRSRAAAQDDDGDPNWATPDETKGDGRG